MTQGEASEVLTILAAAFPQRWRNATPEETQLWIEFLSTLDFQASLDTTSKIVNSASQMPSVAEFRMTYRMTMEPTHELPESEYSHDPQTQSEWEREALKARAWRAEAYPDTHDPAAGTPLPRTRAEFGREWAAWFVERFGWSPIATGTLGRKMA